MAGTTADADLIIFLVHLQHTSIQTKNAIRNDLITFLDGELFAKAQALTSTMQCIIRIRVSVRLVEEGIMKFLGAAILALFVCSEDAISLGPHKHHPVVSLGQVPMRLKGGEGYSLVVPEDFPTMEKALKFLESERVCH